jgi:formylglycine-generating enzyme required for sulfatase activity
MRTPDSSTPPPPSTGRPVERHAEQPDPLDEAVASVLEAGPAQRAELLDLLESRDGARARAVRERLAALGELGLEIDPEPRDATPARFGPYRLVQRVAVGGMGEVHLARDERTGGLAAVKLVRPEYLPFENARLRFQREVEAVRRLDHPGIVRVLDVGEERGVPWLAMEWVGGASLQAVIEELGGVPPGTLERGDLESAVLRVAQRQPHAEPARAGAFEGHDHAEVCARIVARLAEALAHAHAAGVLHRDVKPSNVLVTPSGRVLLADFGLALSRDADRMTRSGAWLGSLPYAAPEQVDGGGRALDARADVYSLGATLYELVTLRTPFLGGPESAVRRRITTGELEPPRRLNPHLSGPIGAVCQAALDLDRARRPPSARALADDLWRALRGEPVRARPAPAWLRAGRWVRRRPLAAAGAALGALVVAGSLALAAREAALARRLTRLADAELVRGLLEESREFWPAEPHEVAAMDAWLARAEEALARRGVHQGALDELRARALPYTEEDRLRDQAGDRERLAVLMLEIEALQRFTSGGGQLNPPPPIPPDDAHALTDEVDELVARPGDEALQRVRKRLSGLWAELLTEPVRWQFDLLQLQDFSRTWDQISRSLGRRTIWSFEEPIDAWRHAALARLLEELGRLEHTVSELRVQRATTARQAQHHAGLGEQAWREACAAIAASPRYAGLRVTPQFDLVPLGANVASGLWEFVLPASGRAPAPDPDRAGGWRMDGEAGIVLVLIPAGRFVMGQRQDERPAQEWSGVLHEVELDAYLISRFELTQGQVQRLGGVDRQPSAPEDPRLPMALDYFEAEALLARAGLWLPTEAQWERAARADDVEPFVLEGAANVFDLTRAWAQIDQGQVPHADHAGFEDGFVGAAPVGWFRPNAFGLHDVLGNLAEWCRERYVQRGYASLVPRRGDGLRSTIVEAAVQVVRGGNHVEGFSTCQPGYRIGIPPGRIRADVGARPVRALRFD